jgi:hypothetical protein
MRFKVGSQHGRVVLATACEAGIVVSPCRFGESEQYVVEEEAKPHAFTAARRASPRGLAETKQGFSSRFPYMNGSPMKRGGYLVEWTEEHIPPGWIGDKLKQ